MITAEDMKELEDSSGVSKTLLMERAGKGIAQYLKENEGIKNKRILIVAYHGNNGGDGFVAARHLADEAEVDVLFVGDDSRFTEESKVNYKRIENIDTIQLLALESVDFSDYDCVVDAIFGTGLTREVKDPLATLIKNLSKTKAKKISVDVPTGVNPNTGEKTNVHFEPDVLLAIHDLKKGLDSYKDRATIIDIGLTKD